MPGELVTALVEPEEELDVVVAVWNEDEESLLETTDLSYAEEQVYFLPPAAGNYSLRVYGYEGATGTYALTLQGTAATIFELAPGDQVTGRLPQGEALEYLLRPDPNATITINAEGDAGTDVTLAVEDLDGSLLATVDETGTGEAESLRFDAPAGSAGDAFLLRVEAFSGRAGSFTLSYE